MHPERMELLQNMPIFGAIRDDVLEFLLSAAPTVEVPIGEYFFREREIAQSMFVLETGAALVIKTWQGQDHVLHGLVAGDCFGEMALIDLLPRSASVRAEQDCRAIELASADFMRLFERDAEQFALIQMNIGREISRRLRAADELLFRTMMGAPPPPLAPVFRAT